MERELGFLDRALSLQFGGFSIETLPTISESLKWIQQQGVVVDGWIDPDRDHPIRTGPYANSSNSWRYFVLPNSHRLTHPEGDDPVEHEAEYLTMLLGFLHGTRLTPEGWRHFHRVPLRPRRLVDFDCEPTALVRILGSAHRHWETLSTEARRHLFAAFHWWLLGACYQEEYESFSAHYTSLDACWRVFCSSTGTNPRSASHANRVNILANTLGIPLPKWALPDSQGETELSTMRNKLVHEGLYGGEPVGFNYPSSDCGHDLRYFVSRVLIVLISGECGYTRSEYRRMKQHIKS